MAQVHELIPTKTKRKGGKRRAQTAKPKPKAKDKKKKKTAADRADKHTLYERAVQAPEHDLDFMQNLFEERYGRTPHDLREDFCGTAKAACMWAKRRPENRAWGVDLDPDPLAWGTKRHLAKLSDDAQKRVTLLEGNVLSTDTPKVDLLAAQNFSYCIFKTRQELVEYFEVARSHLKDEGLFILDIFGGPDAIHVEKEKTKNGKFTYEWDQSYFDPINNHIICHIHFRFKDGSRMKKAFTYDWRLWTIPELRELLLEAGFKRADVYWEGFDDDGEGNGEFTRMTAVEQEDAWVAYVVGGC